MFKLTGKVISGVALATGIAGLGIGRASCRERV